MIDKFTKARKCGTPLIAIHSSDPEMTMSAIQASTSGTSGDRSYIPVIQWDIVSGWQPRNEAGRDAMGVVEDPDETISPTRSLELALELPERTILFCLNVRHFLDKPDFCQALWNLRDEFKATRRTCVLIGSEFNFPSELRRDIFILDEPLPTDEQLKDIVDRLTKSNKVTLSKEVLHKAVDALRGVAAFPAEQAVAMALDLKSSEKLDVPDLWEYKHKMVSSTPGLKLYAGKEKFDELGGCSQVKTFLTNVLNGREAPRVIVFIDEGEKMFAGATGPIGDSSGVSQDFLGTTLSYMEDNECDGAIFVGPPGAAKSAIAKAMGNEAEVPTIMLDLGGMKGSLVGQSESQLREAFKVISAVGGGKAYFIMTCNKIVALPPELKRRFTSGVFFFDLPTVEERKAIWGIYLKKFEFTDVDIDQIDFDSEWTGAEIRNCCRMAYRQKISIEEASAYIVPVAKTASDQITQLRQQASGVYLSANSKGVYTMELKTKKARMLS